MRFPRFMVLLGVFALSGCHKQKPAPSIDGLTDALQRSAEKALSVPSLADEQIVVTATAGSAGSETPEIEHIIATAGATAVSSQDDQGRTSIMAEVPTVNVDALKAALRRQKATMEPGPYTSTRLIEVLIENATPTPTP
jgi:hypothetical protein